MTRVRYYKRAAVSLFVSLCYFHHSADTGLLIEFFPIHDKGKFVCVVVLLLFHHSSDTGLLIEFSSHS